MSENNKYEKGTLGSQKYEWTDKLKYNNEAETSSVIVCPVFGYYKMEVEAGPLPILT
jgi:hypothetical protein